MLRISVKFISKHGTHSTIEKQFTHSTDYTDGKYDRNPTVTGAPDLQAGAKKGEGEPRTTEKKDTTDVLGQTMDLQKKKVGRV